MTGMEIMAGLSFVDERFIAEAETARLGRNTPWLKVLSVAACLCILVVGALAMGNFGRKSAMEAAAPAEPMAAPTEAPAAAAPESAVEGAPLVPAEEAFGDAETEESGSTDELYHIAGAKLRVTRVGTEDSFEAIVEEIEEATDLFAVGDQILLVVDPDKVPGQIAEITNDLSWVTEGAVVMIKDGAYDAGVGILYAAQLYLETGE